MVTRPSKFAWTPIKDSDADPLTVVRTALIARQLSAAVMTTIIPQTTPNMPTSKFAWTPVKDSDAN